MNIDVDFAGEKFSFLTEKGVFSPGQLDLGSRILLETVVDYEAKNVLDLGCGYGVIGIIFAKFHPESFVTLLDNDPMVLALARENAASNAVTNVRLFKADVTFQTVPQIFDLILCNPPWTKNRSVIPKLVKFAFDHLSDNGKFCLVINKTFRTEDFLAGTFGNFEIIADRPPYKILQATRRS